VAGRKASRKADRKAGRKAGGQECRQTDRQTGHGAARQMFIDTYRQTEIKAYWHTQTCTDEQKDRQTVHKYRTAGRQKNRCTDRQMFPHTYTVLKQTYRKTDKKGKQTNR
jgi:hypothetical protein